MQTMPAFDHGFSEMMASVTTTSSVPISGRYANSLDFDQYLLASSPPGFTHNVLSKSGVCDSIENYGYLESDNKYLASSDWYSSSSQFHGSSIKGSKHEQQLQLLANAQPLAFSSTAKSPEAGRRSMSDTNVAAANTTSRSRCGRVKKVSFADDYGLRLTEIKFFSETPDMPPVIKMRLTSNGPKAISTAHTYMQSLINAASVNPILVPDFPMPISDIAALNEKVERDFVSLESLYVVTNWTLAGIVKVKNIAFMKKVFVRCSFDAWRSHVDVPCSYRPASYLDGNDHSYDWFTFTLSVPTDFKAGGSADFAICFQCNDKEYWDNNFGGNYVLASPDWLKKDVEDLVAGSMNLKWTSYVDWKDRSMSWPYW
jgi:protein phosphatase 1 regulatory subunit 3A/B/C/D/E